MALTAEEYKEGRGPMTSLGGAVEIRIFPLTLAFVSEQVSSVGTCGNADHELNHDSGRMPTGRVGMAHRRNEPMGGGSDEGSGDKAPDSRFRDVSLHVL